MKKLFALLLAIFLLSATAVAGLAASSDNSVKVINNLADRNIDTKELLRVINEAEISLMKELQQLKKENFTFNYVFIGDEVSYLYEKSANGLAEIVVFPTYESKKNSSAVDKDSFSDGTVSPAAQVDLPDGIGGRVRIHQNGSILTTRVKTSTSSQVAPGAGEAYLYAGFGKSDGSVETDIGLIWSTTYELWKPYFLYNNGQADKGYFVTPYNEVQYKNGFIPGEIINFTIYKNYNGKIRYKAEGYAKYSDRNGNGGVTWLISVMESNKTPSIGNVDYWKVLATVAKSETGKVYGEFMDIKLDGSTPTLGTPEEDHAKITVNQNQGKVTISVNSDLY